uniref:Macaca fascicularis brain cDNA, clone: QflA-22393 n=2 Tax=Macaca TaxID=9539 RepID=I7G7B7_MACFA|nr:unnamed protein product [Macaca fascicularis]
MIFQLQYGRKTYINTISLGGRSNKGQFCFCFCFILATALGEVEQNKRWFRTRESHLYCLAVLSVGRKTNSLQIGNSSTWC